MDTPKKTVLIFGSTGMLGTYLTNYLSKSSEYHIVPISRQDFDVEICTVNELEILISNHKPSVVINALGKIPQASGSKPASCDTSYFKVNATFPITLDRLSRKLDFKFIHITTDCVFSGNKGGYTEDDICDVETEYGLSKWYGEQVQGTVIRTSIIGENSKGYSLLEWVRANKGGKVLGYVNHKWNGVTCLQLSKVIEQIIKKKMYWCGVRHIYSPCTLSKGQLVSLINNQYDLNIDIEMKDTYNPCDRSLASKYDTSSCFKIPDLYHQILEMSLYSSESQGRQDKL